jgi:neutral trehalase
LQAPAISNAAAPDQAAPDQAAPDQATVVTATREELPRLIYDHQALVDLFDATCELMPGYWRRGGPESGFGLTFCDPAQDRVSQVAACCSTFSLVYSNREFPVEAQLDAFYAKQQPCGAIHGEYRLVDGQPILIKANPHGVQAPLFAWAEYNMYHRLGSKRRLREVLPILERYYQWIKASFRRDNGLLSVPRQALGMGNSPRDRAAYPVDFNAQQAASAAFISTIADSLNDKEVAFRYKREYFALKTRIQSLMWSEEDSIYYDLDRYSHQLKVKTIAAFWTLLAEIPSEDKARRLIGHLTNPQTFGGSHPFPSLAADEALYDPHGGGYRGSVLPFVNYAIIKGLERYGKIDLAREFALRHLFAMHDVLVPDKGMGDLWDAYAPEHEAPAKWHGKGGFPRKSYLPFAALSTVALVIENVLGLTISLPRKTVDWTLPVLEGMGIDNLTLRRNLVSIQTHNSDRGWEVRLESEKLYYLAIRVLGRRRKTLPIPSGKCGILVDKL